MPFDRSCGKPSMRYSSRVLRQSTDKFRFGQTYPRVGIVLDTSTAFGRSILRGIQKYANLQRHWLIYKEMARASTDVLKLPDCDGIIVGGVRKPLVDGLRQRCKNMVHCSGGGNPEKCLVVCGNDRM